MSLNKFWSTLLLSLSVMVGAGVMVGGQPQPGQRSCGNGPCASLGANTFTGLQTMSSNGIAFSNGTILLDDALDALAQRRGTNPQAFRVYNTFTDASNYERGIFSWGSNTLTVGVDVLGTGATTRVLFLQAGTGGMGFRIGGNHIFTMDGSGLIPQTNNAYDAGSSGARFRSIFAGTSLNIGTAAVTFSGAVPTISSGFGASPSVVSGTATAFTINVGTGGTAQNGVIGLPTATTGWNCTVRDLTNNATFVTDQTASSTTTATVQNYSRTTGLAIAWTASDILRVTCVAY